MSAGMVLQDLHKLLCSAVVFHLLHQFISPLFLIKKWQVQVISLRIWPTIVKLFLSHGILVVFVVLFTKRLELLTNTRTPYALVHMMAVHTAFHNQLVTRGCGCTWSLRYVHVHWDVLTGIDCAFIGRSWQALMDPTHWPRLLLVALDRNWWTRTL